MDTSASYGQEEEANPQMTMDDLTMKDYQLNLDAVNKPIGKSKLCCSVLVLHWTLHWSSAMTNIHTGSYYLTYSNSPKVRTTVTGTEHFFL